jgi:outer membrane protein assembly factor BamE (lipoprotein component of BamABCDE complex)
MKFKNIVIFVLVISSFVLTSCGHYEKQRNIENLKLLRKGMSKIEVKAVMGDPLVDEVYNQEDVWYYFTESQWSDGSKTRDECTPLFFEDGNLAGWGQKEYKKFRQKNW